MKAGHIARKALAGLALLCAAGCLQEDSTNEWVMVDPSRQMGDVTMYRDIQFADIPVPAGYALIPQDSYSFQSALFRNGILKYHGPVDSTYAVNYYRRHLPARGWRQDNTEKGYNVRVLYFSKGQERLIVIVRDLDGGSRTELQLDNIDKNDLLLKGKLTDPGYTAPPTYIQQPYAPLFGQPNAPLMGQPNTGQALPPDGSENVSGSSPMR